MIIAIDGPAASGKGTLAKRIALRCDKKAAVFLGFVHFVACLHNLRVTARIGSLADLPNFGHRR